MRTATSVRHSTLVALQRLAAVAERSRIYTRDLVWRPQLAPAW
jgi:hypothetical protein